MLADGVHPPTVTLPVLPAHVGALRPGQILYATVQARGENLTVHVAGARVALPAGAGLEAGQAVTVEVADSRQGLQLRIVPQPPAGGAGPSGGMENLVAAILESLGAAAGVEQPAGLVPAGLAHTADGVRALLALFAQRGTLGDDLAQVVALVDQAAAANAWPRAEASALRTLIEQLVVAQLRDLAPAVRQLAGGAGHALEARLASALAAGRLEDLTNLLEKDLRGHLARLRDNPGLLGFLRRGGQDRAFEATLDRVLNRLLGGQLQNLRGLEQPYVFVEVPCAPGFGLLHAQIHVFSEGRGRGRSFEKDNVMVAFDLATTRLGDLWIALRITHGRCVCRLNATSPAAVAILTEAADDLAEALARTGHPGARVDVALWDGDRVRETASLMRRFAGINVQA